MIVNRVDHLKIGTRNNWLQGTLSVPSYGLWWW